MVIQRHGRDRDVVGIHRLYLRLVESADENPDGVTASDASQQRAIDRNDLGRDFGLGAIALAALDYPNIGDVGVIDDADEDTRCVGSDGGGSLTLVGARLRQG